MYRCLPLTLLLCCSTAVAAPAPLQQALARAGLEAAQSEPPEDGHLRVSCKWGGQTLEEPRLRAAVIAAMLAIREAHPTVTHAAIQVAFFDGQVLEIAGDPGLFRGEMGEAELLRAASVRFLTRGPALTTGPCSKGMSCKKNPERCPCVPGSLCEPDDEAADRTGCMVVRAARNTEATGPLSTCQAGHTWDREGMDCVPLPRCGPGLATGGRCVCPPGVENNTTGGCGTSAGAAAPDAGPPDAGQAPADGGPAAASHAAVDSETGFPRWVWQAMAAGVLLSVPIALFLIGSILGNLRSRRSRIGLKKYCIHCGRKLGLEDARCRKCHTEQP